MWDTKTKHVGGNGRTAIKVFLFVFLSLKGQAAEDGEFGNSTAGTLARSQAERQPAHASTALSTLAQVCFPG